MMMMMIAVSEAVRTDVQHPGPVDDVVFEMGAGAVVEAVAGLDGLLL